MSPLEKQPISARDRALQARFRQAGALILAAGLLSAALVNWRAANSDLSNYEQIVNNTKSNAYEMEMVGGKANIFASEAREWFGGLWHGKGLAHTLAFLSVGGSAACFFVAHRLGFPPRRARPAARKGA